MTQINPNSPCPCHSSRKYKRCCGPLHRGAPPPSAQALMRSRYAAYSLALVDYIIATTHPNGPQYQVDVLAWRTQLARFSQQTTFEHLEVLSENEGPVQGHVAFRATLRQGDCDVSFSEQSLFVLHEGRWLYHSGERLP